MICIGEAVQLVFLVADFLLNLLDAIHCSSESGHLSTQRLVANLFESLVNFVAKSVVAAESEQLLVGVIRRRAVVMIRGCVDITLVYNPSFIHAPPHRGVYSHAYFDPLGWGDAMSIGGRYAEWDVVGPPVAYEAVGSGG
jgi:hypothetical protein